MKVHPVAEMFPMMQPGTKDWNILIDGIQANGQLEPCVRDGDVLLDGRNRLMACEVLKITPKFIEWSSLGLSVTQSEWIAEKNLARRHLTDDQKATIGYEISGWQAKNEAAEKKTQTQFKGQAGPGRGNKTVTSKSTQPFPRNKTAVQKVAAQVGVSEHKVRQAQKVSAHKQVLDDVKAGKIKLSDAVKKIPAKPKKERTLKYEPTNGMQFAEMAIEQLKRIHPDDKQRDDAFDEVIAWINKQRKP